MRKRNILIGSTAFLFAAASAVFLGVGSASAHNADINGVASCAPSTGLYTISWTGQLTSVPAGDVAAITVLAYGPAGSTGPSAVANGLVGNVGYTFTQTGVSAAASAATVQVQVVWTGPSPLTRTINGSVALSGPCLTSTSPTPTPTPTTTAPTTPPPATSTAVNPPPPPSTSTSASPSASISSSTAINPPPLPSASISSSTAINPPPLPSASVSASASTSVAVDATIQSTPTQTVAALASTGSSMGLPLVIVAFLLGIGALLVIAGRGSARAH